jgi:subtilisin family serine protease
MKRIGLLALTAAALAACSDNAPTDPAHTTLDVTDNRVGSYIVVLKPGSSDRDVDDASDRVASSGTGRKAVLRYKRAFHGFATQLSAAELDRVKQDPNVDHVEPDIIVHQVGTQSSPGWALDRIDQRALPLNNSYSYGGTGSGVNVYILDGGIRYSHVDLGGRARFAYDAFGGNGSDCNGHGTAVAGVVGGSTKGIAKQTTLWSVRVLKCDGSAALSSILAGVDWITANHRAPAVVNMSIGAGIAPILDSAVARSVRAGVTYAVAAGNSGADACASSPAKLPQVITVGAIDQTDTRPSWSNYGACVTLFAPGLSVASDDYFADNSTANWNGTSLSAPFAAGVAALYLQQHPTATPAQVKSALVNGATTGALHNAGGSPNRIIFSGAAGSTTSTTTSTGTFTSKQVHSAMDQRLCANVRGATSAPNTPLIIWDCVGSTNEIFTLNSAGELRVYGSMCATDEGGRNVEGDRIIIYPCQGLPSQKWTLNSSGMLVNSRGKCIDVKGAVDAAGTSLILWSCWGGKNQKWAMY